MSTHEAFPGSEFGPPPPAEAPDSVSDEEKKKGKKKPSEALGPQGNIFARRARESAWRTPVLKRPGLLDSLRLQGDEAGSKEKDKDDGKAGPKESLPEAERPDTSDAARQHAAGKAEASEEAVPVPQAAQEVLEYVSKELGESDNSPSVLEPGSPEASADEARTAFLQRIAEKLQPLTTKSESQAGGAAPAEAAAASQAAVESVVQTAYRGALEQVVPPEAVGAEELKIHEAIREIEAVEEAGMSLEGTTVDTLAPVPAEASATEDAVPAPSHTVSTARGAAGSAFGAGGSRMPPPAGAFHAAAVPLPPPPFGVRGYANAPLPVHGARALAEQPRRAGEWIPPFIAGAVVMRLIDNRRLRRERKQHKTEMSKVLRTVDVMSARISQLGLEARQRVLQAARPEAPPQPAASAAEARAVRAVPAPEAPPPLVVRAAAEGRQPLPGAGTPAERAAMPPVVPIYERRSAAGAPAPSAAERPADRLPGENQPEQPTPVVLWQAENRQQAARAETTRAEALRPAISTARTERHRPQPPVPVEVMSQQELMTAAAEITVDSVSLSSVFENHQVSERGLRRMVAEYYRGGDVRQVLQQEKHIKELSYERDPRYRDQPVGAEEAGGTSGQVPRHEAAQEAADSTFVPAGSAATGSANYEYATPPLLLPPRPRPLLQRHRSALQPALIIANVVALVVLATLLAVLLIVYL